MKKEKERNLTLEQLEKRMNIASKISSTSVILIFLGVIALFFIVGITKNPTKEFKGIVIGMYFMIGFLLYIIGYTALTIRDKYKQKINTIKKQKKADEIKRLGQAGNIKDLVYIEDPEIIMHILSRGFTVIEIVDHIEDSFFVNFRLKGQKEFGMHSTILKKEFLDLFLFYDDEKQEFLDNLIDTVKVETIQDENGERTKLQIAMKDGYLYTNSNITDEELIEMLKVKK